MARRSGLGKGLEALFQGEEMGEGTVTQINISRIEPNQNQPRTSFDDEALRELADSIRSHGLIQPLVVRPMERGGYQIVAGERRWRASRMAGLTEVPAIIRELDDAETLEIAIIENLQREDLNAIELAQGYRSLMDRYSLTQEQVAEKLGKSRSAVANTVRLLALPPAVQEHIRQGKITQGHAKALLALEESDKIVEAANLVVSGKLLVRDIERMAQSHKVDAKRPESRMKPKTTQNDEGQGDKYWGGSFKKEIELALTTSLGRKVSIHNQGKKYVLEIEFYKDEELADLAARLEKNHR
jgi:ParB family chromosome partitioning protein